MPLIAGILHPLRFPLYGSRLIEASAGTGKTYTIAALYVRLVLGHGGDEYAYPRPLTPAEILVVTFTDAATKELRDRIRLRLQQAAAYFLVTPHATALVPDDFLDQLRADYPTESWLACARQLRLAAESMDEAAISTIHSWCNRMLREHAFKSGNLFNQTLVANQTELLAEVVRDYWRIFMVPLDAHAVANMRQYKLSTPALLLDKIKDIIDDAALLANDAEPDNNYDQILRHALRWIAQRFAAEQQRRAGIGFNDLLTRLDAALQSPHGSSLAASILRQFPAALIDEFQDTDPAQYRIFDNIYQVAENNSATVLVMIGDPKQAIYAFRGADIYTYLAARHACNVRRYTLKENFRSTNAMVAATNHCFAVAELRQSGAGAFMFRNATSNSVPFLLADARGLSNKLFVENSNATHAALTIWLLPGTKINKATYHTHMAAICANEIARLLNLGQNGHAGFIGPNLTHNLGPADIAVLVNNHTEADAIRAALAKRGVRSVYLSDKDSVFHCPQALDLQHWLAACAEPDNSRLLRAALATATLGLSWTELDTLNHDELMWEAQVVRFRAYYDCWHQQGILPMLRRLLNDFQIPARLLQHGYDGERILTNILHLAELLQQASMLLDGEHAIMRYLAEQRQRKERKSKNDTDKIRLESDADLVRVVTVHKSKGLDYPLVFFPFAASYHKITRRDLPLLWHDAQGQSHLELNGELDAIIQAADQERLSEDLRKFYVALTRARYATWIGLAPVDKLERSAPGYLLNGGQVIAPNANAIAALVMKNWCDSASGNIVVATTTPAEHHYQSRAVELSVGSARTSLPVVREHWWIASYAALQTVDVALHTVPDTHTADIFQEVRASSKTTSANVLPPVNTQSLGWLHDFPRGPEAGTFLHDLLEWAAHQGFRHLATQQELLRETITKRCELHNWACWIEPLTRWLHNFLITQWYLPTPRGQTTQSFSLVDLSTYIAEMEFWLAAHHVDINQLDQLISGSTLDKMPRPPLQPGQINGMLKGFIDLVCEYNGRYYVIDYKSNWLGADDSAYTAHAMRNAILQSRYELQYVLYLFALHRLLQSRLPDYHYDQHIGGAIYIFLRGSSAMGQSIHIECPPYALLQKLDELFVALPTS